MPGDDAIPIFRFLDRKLADVVETLGKGRRKTFRHMLRNDNGWRIGRQAAQHVGQRFRSPRRCPDGNNGIRGLQHRTGVKRRS